MEFIHEYLRYLNQCSLEFQKSGSEKENSIFFKTFCVKLQLYRNIFDEEFLLRSRPSSFSRFRCFRSAAARGETNSAAMHRNATVKSKVDDASPAAAAAPMSFSQSSAEPQSV